MTFRAKLFLAILTTTFLTALLVTVAVYRGAGSELQRFIRSQEQSRLDDVADTLTETLDSVDWQRLETRPIARQLALRRAVRGQLQGTDSPPGRGINVLPRDLVWHSGRAPRRPGTLQQAVVISDQPAGTLVMQSRTAWQSRAEQRFQRAQRRRAALALVIALLCSAGVAALLTRGLNRPIRELAKRTAALAEGQRQCDWQTQRGDEFGTLHRALDELDRALCNAEEQQRQWLSDTAHELRTPLSILRGELEAIADGVRPWDCESLKSLQSEVAHLTRLVEALHELSLAESNRLPLRKNEIELREWLSRALNRHQDDIDKAGHQLQQTLGDQPLLIHADPNRLQQILDNLIRNAMRYTEPPGQIQVRLHSLSGMACIDVCDGPPAPTAKQMLHLFDRFYRAEAGRSGNGAGLGLAIVKALTQQHGGTVRANRSDLGGLCVQVTLPMTSQELEDAR